MHDSLSFSCLKNNFFKINKYFASTIAISLHNFPSLSSALRYLKATKLQRISDFLLVRGDFKALMADWAPVLIGVVLFVLLQPGLLFQLPGHHRQLEFGSMKTNGKSIAIHTLIFFAIYAVLILAVHVHIYTG